MEWSFRALMVFAAALAFAWVDHALLGGGLTEAIAGIAGRIGGVL